MNALLVRRLGLILLSASSLLLGACAHHRGPSRDAGYYPEGAYQDRDSRENRESRGYARPQQAQYGYVRSIEQLQGGERVDGGGGAGALVGGVIGGVIGNQMGGKGNGRAATTMLGAVGGAIIGSQIDRQNSRQEARGAARDVFHVLVRLDNRSEQWFDFDRLDDLRVGDRVRVENGRLQRL